MADYETKLGEWKHMYEALNNERQWLKEETSSHITQLYKLKESNYQLTHQLEEERQLVDALQER